MDKMTVEQRQVIARRMKLAVANLLEANPKEKEMPPLDFPTRKTALLRRR